MLRTIKLVFLFSSITAISFAQTKVQVAPNKNGTTPVTNKNVAPKLNPVAALPVPTPQPTAPALPAMKRINAGLEYAIVVNKPTSPNPKEGDLIRINLISAVNNRMMYNSFTANKGKPVEFGMNKAQFKGDIIDAIALMTPGDSAICLADAQAVFANSKNKMPDFIKKGDKVIYFIKLVSIKTKEQMQKEQQAAFKKQMDEQMAKMKKEQEKNIVKEEKELQTYFKTNNITPIKTTSGLYYTIKEASEDIKPNNGDTVVMNYTGKLMNGTKFDSNEDSTFNHVQPFEFSLGAGRVIKGWDEGVALLNKGSKATFYIPSRYGYGANAQAKIPANSILIFDVELKNIKPKTETIKTETK